MINDTSNAISSASRGRRLSYPSGEIDFDARAVVEFELIFSHRYIIVDDFERIIP